MGRRSLRLQCSCKKGLESKLTPGEVSLLCSVTGWEHLTRLICRVHHVKYQAGLIISWNQDCWENYQQPQICIWYHRNGKKWRGSKESLEEGERGDWKSLKHNIKNTKIMASSPMTSWQIQGGKVEAVNRFYSFGLQKSLRRVTAAVKLSLVPLRENEDKPRQHINK